MAKMRISPELKKLIEKYRCVKDTEGMSPAKVYKLVGENENLYLKMTDSRYKGTTYDVEREKDMMLWLEGKLPVPKVLHFERHDGWSNLLMSEADGVLCSEEYEDEQSPEKIIELYAECIRLFHSIDISDCPYTNSLDSRLAELDYLLNNDLADVDCENWEEDTPFKDPRELYDFLKTEKPEEETAVELARRKAVVEPSIVVPQGYQGRVQYLLPICLTDMEQPDLSMTLTIMDGYYLGNTCLTLEMAYLNARLLSRPVAHWLTDIVEE